MPAAVGDFAGDLTGLLLFSGFMRHQYNVVTFHRIYDVGILKHGRQHFRNGFVPDIHRDLPVHIHLLLVVHKEIIRLPFNCLNDLRNRDIVHG